jgi:hypothetical protein
MLTLRLLAKSRKRIRMHTMMLFSKMHMIIAICWESFSERQSMCIALGVYAYFGGFQGGALPGVIDDTQRSCKAREDAGHR